MYLFQVNEMEVILMVAVNLQSEVDGERLMHLCEVMVGDVAPHPVETMLWGPFEENLIERRLEYGGGWEHHFHFWTIVVEEAAEGLQIQLATGLRYLLTEER